MLRVFAFLEETPTQFITSTPQRGEATLLQYLIIWHVWVGNSEGSVLDRFQQITHAYVGYVPILPTMLMYLRCLCTVPNVAALYIPALQPSLNETSYSLTSTFLFTGHVAQFYE